MRYIILLTYLHTESEMIECIRALTEAKSDHHGSSMPLNAELPLHHFTCPVWPDRDRLFCCILCCCFF